MNEIFLLRLTLLFMNSSFSQLINTYYQYLKNSSSILNEGTLNDLRLCYSNLIEIEIKHSSFSSQYDDLVSKFLNLVATNVKTRGNFIKEYRKLSSCIFTKNIDKIQKDPQRASISPSNTVPSGISIVSNLENLAVTSLWWQVYSFA